ncbi:MAG: competence protein CoiA family protein [Acidobacteriota bacterium]
MLCAIRQSDQTTVTANSQSKANAPFTCPVCADTVVLRKGTVRIHHFAHKPPVTCNYGAGETEAHRRCKSAIYEGLLQQPTVKKAELERYLKTVRPDVSAWISDIPVAIEVQISALSIETIIHRTQEYTRKGIYLLWLAQWDPSLDSDRYSPSAWERWLHAAYLGRIYYWAEGLLVIPYHMAPYSIYVEENEWYSSEGERLSAGGYERISKRYKTPIRGRTLDITKDFRRADQEEWSSATFSIPRRKIFLDRYEKPKSNAA